jgi:hypothetical protein
MALLIAFSVPTDQTYPNPALPFPLQNGNIEGNAVVDWTPGSQTSPGSPSTYTVNTNAINSVLLTPDPQYAYYLNQGVGGVATIIEFTPSGSFVGPAITEGVLVGSFAYWNTVLPDLTGLTNYVVGNGLSSEESAINDVRLALAGLLQGQSPSTEAAAIQQAANSVHDSTFASYASDLVSIATNWDKPIYFLNTGSGAQYYTSDPAPFGVSLFTENGADSTWSVNGKQGTVQVSGYSEFSTYDINTNQAFYNIVPADANGDLAVASQGLTVAQALAAFSANPSVTDLNVFDTPANVTANLNALENIEGAISAIGLTATGTSILSITGSQSFNDSEILQKIDLPFGLSITQDPGDLFMAGGPGNDTFYISDGGSKAEITGIGTLAPDSGGHDTVVFHGTESQYTIAQAGPNEYLVDVTDSVAGRDGTVTIGTNTGSAFSVQYLQFTDKVFFLETSDNADIARLYSAAFDRTPDQTGLSGWEDIYAHNIPSAVQAQGVYAALAQTNDGYGTTIAGGFTQSVEFTNKYGALNDTAFVTQLYANVLGRMPDAGGLNGWLNLMHNEGFTRDMVLVGFAESPENIAKAAAWMINV